MKFLPSALCLLAAAVMHAQTSDVAPITKYKVFDLGGFGGPFSGFFNADYTGDEFSPKALNGFGEVAGFFAPTPTTGGSFVWSFRKSRVLPSLPGNLDGSNALGINNLGLAVGASSYGPVDPMNGAAYYHAVSWTNGVVQDLGDLGGFDSWANYVNEENLVVGYAYNTTPDPYSYYGNQYHATTWTNGAIADLGTLGGTDSEAWTANNRGSVIGVSLTNDIPIPPYNQPQQNAFVWTDGTMTDLGNLGGVISTPSAINALGAISVISLDATNQYVKGYVWKSGSRTILNSPGGNFVEPLTLNDLGVSTGAASDPTDTNFVAAVWNRSGQGKSLGTVGTDAGSTAFGINTHNVIVGGSGLAPVNALGSFAHAFVWQNGKLQDLNTLIPDDSPLVLNVAYAINEAGMIAGEGTNSAGEMHAFVLVPESLSSAEPFATAASRPAIAGSVVTAPASASVKPMRGFRSR